ncbi:hypothetical protein [Marinomonas ostreistagni]|uniref:c-type cytochrome biogenesis protein CcmI/CycH n=1 Tax=Marinomonas ostreistagni TaxID=359209 RepID=UPI00194E5DC7|nr:hypothetical protein [Marinomonas ostreistagni]MBM6551283.1 hypothetical protein [Marinomonas ostreistagni]
MMMAWLVMAAIAVLSVLYVMRALFGAANRPIKERDSERFIALREQEVAEELQAGRLTQDEANQLRDDLALEAQYIDKQQFYLIKDLNVTRWVLSAMVAVVLVGALALYQQLGFSKEVAFTEKMLERSATEQDISEFLAYRVARYDRAEDWYYLASEQVLAEDYADAVESYQQVLQKLDTDSPDYINVQVELAQAMFYNHDNTVSEPMRELVTQALQSNPNHVKALGLMGIVQFDAKRYKEAILAWQKAIRLGNDPQARNDLLSGITAARKQGAISEEEVPALISHRVQLSLTLTQGQLAADDVFLVYATANGQTMPVAIQRISSAEFGAPLVLTNLDNLMPGKSLAEVEEVDIVVKHAKQTSQDLSQGQIVGYLSPVPSNSDKIFNVKVAL